MPQTVDSQWGEKVSMRESGILWPVGPNRTYGKPPAGNGKKAGGILLL